MDEINLNWSGVLTAENCEQVAKLLRQFLAGKKFTFLVSVTNPRNIRMYAFQSIELNRESNNPIQVCDREARIDIDLPQDKYHVDYVNPAEKPFLSFDKHHGVISVCQTSYHIHNTLLFWVFFIERD